MVDCCLFFANKNWSTFILTYIVLSFSVSSASASMVHHSSLISSSQHLSVLVDWLLLVSLFLQILWGYYCKAYLSISVPLRPRTRPWLRFWRLTSIRTEENANVINVVSPLFTVFLGIIHTYNFGKSMSAWTLEKTTSKTQNQKVFGSLSLLTSWVFDCKCIGGLDMKPQ